MTTTPIAPQTGQGEPHKARGFIAPIALLRRPLPIELLSALRVADDQLVIVHLLGREPYAFAAWAFNSSFGLTSRAPSAGSCAPRGPAVVGLSRSARR